MISPKDKHLGKSPSSKPPHLQLQLQLQQAFADLQSNCYGFFTTLPSSLNHHLSSFSHLKTHFHHAVSNLQNLATSAVQTRYSDSLSPPPPAHSSCRRGSPLWARISSSPHTGGGGLANFSSPSSRAMSREDIDERLSGVPVYTLCSSFENFVLVTGTSPRETSLGLFCFKKEDADSLLQQMVSSDPSMAGSTKVIAVPLDKVYNLKSDGAAAFRFLPDASQIVNAVREMERYGRSYGTFSGVPVFQSPRLILQSDNRRYKPTFFRKEDLLDVLQKQSARDGKTSAWITSQDIEVGAFEEIVNGMKDPSSSKWNDVVFIPPGFDISADPVKRAVHPPI